VPLKFTRSPSSRFVATVVAIASTVGLLIVAATPLMIAHGGSWTTLGAGVHASLSPLCHQNPERCFSAAGIPMPLCARCTGVLFGVAVVATIALFRSRPYKYRTSLLVIALLFVVLDVVAEAIGYHGNLPVLRFATGMLLGGAMSSFVPQATNAISRHAYKDSIKSRSRSS
jgi:uncharacterized membrane protein